MLILIKVISFNFNSKGHQTNDLLVWLSLASRAVDGWLWYVPDDDIPDTYVFPVIL